MFQNIEGTIRQNPFSKENTTQKIKNLKILNNIFTKQYIAIYIISFMVSQITFSGDFSPFCISLIGACFANSVPVAGVIVSALIGVIIKQGISATLTYILTILVMIATFFILKPRYNEEQRNEKIKLGKNVLISSLIVQLARITISGFTVYDLLASITVSIVIYVFYKIFVNSLAMLQDIREKKAFSIEEVMGTSLLISIAICAFGELSVLGFSIRNILSILIVLILGWKNGILVGTTAGVTIGVTLGIIVQTEPIMIAAYAISGMIAGILNKFGKIGVILGFVLGNIVLAYVANGYTVELIHFKEILIASIGLLALPKNVEINIEEFVGKSKFLPVFSNRGLNKSKEVAENLNNVSETIHIMAKSYKQEELFQEEEKVQREENKQIFITKLLDELDAYKENLLYDDLANTEGKIVQDIFDFLIDKQSIERKDLLKIFAENNSYIVGVNDNKISKYLEDNINQVLRAVNSAYQRSKSDFVWKKKLEQSKKNMKNQLDNVSKAIQDIANNIEKSSKLEEEQEKQREEIITLLKQKQIEVEDVILKKENRYFIEIYLNKNQEEFENVDISEILSKVCKERIVENKEASLGNRINYISDDNYVMGFATANATKNKSEVSGDSILNIRLKDGNYLIAISDGMGSGSKAMQSSRQALKMLENLLLSGFDKNTSIELIKSALISQNEESFATLDIAIVDLYKGKVEFMKSGACPTYLKLNKKVKVVKANSLPTGIIDESKLDIFDVDIQENEIMLMCTDGILDSNVEYKNKELWIKYLLEDIETNNTKKISDLILNEAIDNNYGIPKDDMTIVTCKFMKK